MLISSTPINFKFSLSPNSPRIFVRFSPRKMPRQVLEFVDYLAPFAALLMFIITVLLFAFLVVNFFYITERDDLTVFEKFGAHFHLCLGPHAMSDIYRGGPRAHPPPGDVADAKRSAPAHAAPSAAAGAAKQPRRGLPTLKIEEEKY